jgi:hypothetical protein
MPLTFPTTPTVGQVSQGHIWTGERWARTGLANVRAARDFASADDPRITAKSVGLAYVQPTEPLTPVDGERWIRSTDDTMFTRVEGTWVEYVADGDPLDVIDLLTTDALLYLDASIHDGAGKLRNLGRGGAALDATFGTTGGTGTGRTSATAGCI